MEEREEEDPCAEASKEIVDHILKTIAVASVIMTSKEDSTPEMQWQALTPAIWSCIN